MKDDRGRSETRRDGPWVQARCAWCGDVEFALGELRIHASQETEGLLEFVCPSCGRLNVRPLGHPELAALANAGARPSSGPAPFELLEKHAGPPISWDDLIDFHQVLSRLNGRTSWPRSLMGSEDLDGATAQE